MFRVQKVPTMASKEERLKTHVLLRIFSLQLPDPTGEFYATRREESKLESS